MGMQHVHYYTKCGTLCIVFTVTFFGMCELIGSVVLHPDLKEIGEEVDFVRLWLSNLYEHRLVSMRWQTPCVVVRFVYIGLICRFETGLLYKFKLN